MKRKATNADDLTPDEIAFLKSDRSSQSVRQFTARQHESIGVRTSAYQKVATAARAEREAIMEVAGLTLARAIADGELTAKERADMLEREAATLRQELKRTRQRLESATAAPALAVHSGGSR